MPTWTCCARRAVELLPDEEGKLGGLVATLQACVDLLGHGCGTEQDGHSLRKWKARNEWQAARLVWVLVCALTPLCASQVNIHDEFFGS